MTPRVFMVVLLVVYCAKQVLTAVIFPPFTGHDEVAHWQSIRVLATEGRLPTLHDDTLPPELYEFRRYALQWEQLGQHSTFLYTAVHPPLYYAVMAPIFLLTRDRPPIAQQYLLRCVAIPFGLITVVLAYRLTKTIFPDNSFLAATVPTVVAFQPQISYEAAMINNDILAICLYSWILYLLVRAVHAGVSYRRAALIGFAFGLALLTKISSATALPLILAGFWWARGRDGWPQEMAKLTTAGAVALALVAPWLVFMYATYGDFTGLRALSALQHDAGLTSQARFVDLLFSADFAVARWKETWGEFGWRLIPISQWLLSLLACVAAMAGAGLVVQALAAAHTPRTTADTHTETGEGKALAILAAACVLAYLSVVQFGTQFVLTQARYMFPAAIGAALLGMLGLQAWIPPRCRVVAQGTIVLAALALNIAILTAHVIPYWYFPP